MAETEYKVVYQGGSGEVEEKKSRFIATIVPIETEEDAISFINQTKKKYYDARHNCFAYVIGRNNENQRCSDDGEPSGTAGRPMLDVLIKEGIHNAAVVVTRYFGGTLLGTGGLVRAYQKATQEGLADCTIIEKKMGQMVDITTDYNGIGKIQYIFGQNNIQIVDTQYTEKVVINSVIPMEKKGKIEKDIIEGTNGKSHVSWGEEVFYAFVEKELKIF